jgi:hypothetical protein
VISYVLDRTGWNRSRANKILGISYKTLLAKIQDLELKPNHVMNDHSVSNLFPPEQPDPVWSAHSAIHR